MINNSTTSNALRQALCVGGTSGIGRGMAMKFAQEKINVVIMGRNEKVGKEIVSEMKQLNPEGTYEMMVCDASSMKEIVKACEEFKKKHSRLDYVVLSQGIATTEGRKETPEGIDTKLALHYYGRVMFIKQLNDLLRETSKHTDVRVLNVFSAGVHKAYTNVNDLELKNDYSLLNAANAAGFYNDLAMDQFSREPGNENISFIHAAPGFVATNWGTELPTLLRWGTRFAQLFASSTETCAENMMKGLTSDAMRRGFHLMNPKGEKLGKSLLHIMTFSDKLFGSIPTNC
ncbi:hypothetical protein FDP41_002955 [Naegleria fowleri]|uniref:Uncharacterized protein n=1 Tax=Naegleria fowleri TaxID=5763 RepID=A0A6A5BWC3_NAEFO|nr:uncharacterized protein FDP41_002955 [Naegleria fowleri]KAF0978000.1 hypothetical protein FDP41_002955 [Naegleria fowleri]